jgi:FtsP/CotA-like multicopper oxidase with cupredoxin domain
MADRIASARLSRRGFLKLGAGAATAIAAGIFAGKSLATSGELAILSPLRQMGEGSGDMFGIAATDGWIYLPGFVPAPNALNRSFVPDELAPKGRTAYIFGFANLTAVSKTQALKNQAQINAPLQFVKQGKEYTLRLANLGFASRPDITHSATMHWHGFRNGWPAFDGDPRSTVAAPIGREMNLYYKPQNPGTYIYYSGFEVPDHIQMGMTGAICVRPLQDGSKFTVNGKPYSKFAYNDGDGSTGYDREYILTLTDFWAQGHWQYSHIQTPDWTDFRPDYSLMNGRVYPDTLTPNGGRRYAGELVAPTGRPELICQPYSALIRANAGERVLIRFINMSFGPQTLFLEGLKMKVIARDAAILKQGSQDLFYETNSITFGSGQTVDVIVAIPSGLAGSAPIRYLLYNRGFGQLANPGLSGLGGQMTHIRVYPAGTLPPQTGPNDWADVPG